MPAPWTDDEIELLRKCVVQGMSYGQMLPLFPGRARNALIGKSHRKGFHQLPADPSPPEPVATPPKPRFQMLPDEPPPAPWPEVQKQATQPPAWAPPPLKPAPAEPAPSQPPAGGVLLMALREHHCRWPINDGGPFLFCGCRKAVSSPYCEAHAAKAVRRVSENRREYVQPKVSAFKFRTGS